MTPVNAVAVVQSRYNSARLPGKALLPIGGVPSLSLVLSRLLRSKDLRRVTLATTRAREDDPLVALAERLGVAVYRGDEDDVLGRVIAALDPGEDTVVRVCADRPFVAPEEIDRLLRLHVREGADYSYNHIPEGTGYPFGFGAEAVRRSVLEELGSTVLDAGHREHVTSALWERPTAYGMIPCPAPPPLHAPDVKLDLDTPDDLLRLQRLVDQLDVPVIEATAEQVLDAYRASVAGVEEIA